LSLDRAASLDTQACQIMGNSGAAWQSHYDFNCSLKESQAGIDSTAVSMRAMLERGVQPVNGFECVD